MSTISRRALFGLSASAAAAYAIPCNAASGPVTVGLDFGAQPTALVFGPAGEAYARAVTEVMSRFRGDA
jgi:hypothetical protein